MAFAKPFMLALVAMVCAALAVHQPQRPAARSAESQQTAVKKRTETPAGESRRRATDQAPKVTTQLMFYGKAEEAMKLYTSVLPNSKITSIKRYGKGQAGAEGSVMHATFTLNGREFMCIDSPTHDFTFTPATSLFVTCNTEK